MGQKWESRQTKFRKRLFSPRVIQPRRHAKRNVEFENIFARNHSAPPSRPLFHSFSLETFMQKQKWIYFSTQDNLYISRILNYISSHSHPHLLLVEHTFVFRIFIVLIIQNLFKFPSSFFMFYVSSSCWNERNKLLSRCNTENDGLTGMQTSVSVKHFFHLSFPSPIPCRGLQWPFWIT